MIPGGRGARPCVLRGELNFLALFMRIKALTQLSSSPIPKPLLLGLAGIGGLLIYGLVLLHQDEKAFLVWIREDGLAEWLTFAVLLTMAVFSFVMSRAISRSERESPAMGVWLFIGFLFLFGAMEEISWGQRVLGIESPEWFLKHNAQGETNFHNLVIYGVKINRFVFGTVLGILIGIYLLAVPLLYHLNQRFQDSTDRWGIPIAQNYQILLFIAVVILVEFHLDLAKKAGELRELASSYIFLLIIMHPYNQEIFPLKGLVFWRSKTSLAA
jgi:hypothetical protein